MGYGGVSVVSTGRVRGVLERTPKWTLFKEIEAFEGGGASDGFNLLN